MFRTVYFAAFAAVAFVSPDASRAAETTYYCVPNEPRVTAPDRLVSAEVTLKPNGEFVSVVCRAANGTIIDRSRQYDSTNGHNGQFRYWVGRLCNDPNVAIIGSFQRDHGQLFYLETIHDNHQGGKIVAQVTSLCDGGHLGYAAAEPRPAPIEPPPPVPATTPPAPPAPSPSVPEAELKAFKTCIDAAAAALSILSNEPAQTVVDAALGECSRERVALESALERRGISQSVDFVDGLVKDVRPNLLAIVLNARVAASTPPQSPAKTEPAKGQPL